MIHPPAAKPCEPPAGPARLVGALGVAGVSTAVLDANLGGLLYLLNRSGAWDDTWSKRAGRNLDRHLAGLGSWSAYRRFDRYRRAISDLGRILENATAGSGGTAGLANYQDRELSPHRSRDLIRAATDLERNPYYGYFSRAIPRALEETGTSTVGLSVNYLNQALTSFAMIGFLRRLAPEVKIVAGGGLITSWLSRPDWNAPFNGLVDEMVSGPGEARLLEIAGVGPAAGGAIPDYNQFLDRPYLSPGLILPYSASSGCWWRKCSFCPEAAEGNPYQPVPAARAAAEIGRLTRETRPALIHLLDNAVSPSLLQALIDNPPGAPWYGFVRFTPHLADPDFCRALRGAGCVMLQLGLESGDQQVLGALDKGLDLGLASRALESLSRAGVATYVYLLFGTPAEDEAAAEKTLEYTDAHAEHIDFLNLAVFNLPAHGPGTENVVSIDFPDADLSLYRKFEHPRGWDRKKIRHFLDRKFKRRPRISAILRRDPPIFNSNHAPLFLDAVIGNGHDS